MLICLVGDPHDLSGVYLRWRAEQRGLAVLTLPEQTIGESWTFQLDGAGHGRIEVEGRSIALEDVGGAIVRLNPKPELPRTVELAPEEANVFTVERRHSLQWLLDTAPFPVCNRPHAGRANASKPYQMGLLRRAGFQVPRWIATNQADAVDTFGTACVHGMVYKSCSGLRSHVRQVDDTLRARLAEGSAPVLVQEYIPGHDVRIHVVGERVFPVEVISNAIDYRFDGTDTQYRVTELPGDLARMCVTFAADQGLLLSGFDFRRTRHGEWYCLEVNPVPTFLPYEVATGLGIADAVLDELASGKPLRS